MYHGGLLKTPHHCLVQQVTYLLTFDATILCNYCRMTFLSKLLDVWLILVKTLYWVSTIA